VTAVKKKHKLKKKRKMIKSPHLLNITKPFDGTSGVDVLEFCKRFRLTTKLLEWDAKKQADNLPLYLNGNAMRRYEELSVTEKTDIEKCLDHLTKEFGKSAEEYFIEYQKIQYLEEEGPKSFALKLEETLTRALDKLEVPAKAKNMMLKAQFIDKLPPHIQSMTRMANVEEWKEFVNKVEQSTAALKRTKMEKSELYLNESYKSEPFELEVNKMSYHKKFDGVCFNCGKRGHRKIECRSKPKREEDKLKKPESKKLDMVLNSITINLGLTGLNESCTLQAEQADNMLRVEGEVKLREAKTTINKLPMLVDSGASHSFINSKQLTKDVKNQIREWLNTGEAASRGVVVNNCKVNLVKSIEEEIVIVVPFDIKIGEWSELIISL
jgi:hypothetical protein